ncbi:MAG: glutathione S-transferase family protein [Alphaproteobacteria bacterium]
MRRRSGRPSSPRRRRNRRRISIRCRTPRSARQEAVYRDGLDAPIVADAVRRFDRLFADVDAALSRNGWLAGPAYSLADAAATPYANRLRDLKLLPVWTDLYPRIADWLARIETRPSFKAAVTDYFTENDSAQFGAIEDGTADLAKAILAA